MSNLIDVLRGKPRWATTDEQQQAADEIERLTGELGIVDAWRNKVIVENAKLQAVVDAYASCDALEVDKALAALDTVDGDRQVPSYMAEEECQHSEPLECAGKGCPGPDEKGQTE